MTLPELTPTLDATQSEAAITVIGAAAVREHGLADVVSAGGLAAAIEAPAARLERVLAAPRVTKRVVTRTAGGRRLAAIVDVVVAVITDRLAGGRIRSSATVSRATVSRAALTVAPAGEAIAQTRSTRAVRADQTGATIAVDRASISGRAARGGRKSALTAGAHRPAAARRRSRAAIAAHSTGPSIGGAGVPPGGARIQPRGARVEASDAGIETGRTRIVGGACVVVHGRRVVGGVAIGAERVGKDARARVGGGRGRRRITLPHRAGAGAHRDPSRIIAGDETEEAQREREAGGHGPTIEEGRRGQKDICLTACVGPARARPRRLRAATSRAPPVEPSSAASAGRDPSAPARGTAG